MSQQDLIDLISFPALECLNAHPSHIADNALKQGYREDDGLFLQSDTDEQLLLNIPFNQSVKLYSIVIKGPTDGTGPKTVKLYPNRPSMGFSDVDSIPCAQQIELTDELLAGQPIQLKFVKFQNVTLLTVFIESNQGDEEVTKIQKIALSGYGGETMNVAEIKKQQENA